MLGRVRNRATFANVVSVIALFVALGGTTWALSRNSVGSKQIKPNAVRSSDVKNEGIKGIDVDEAALGQVPTANRAQLADTLDGLDSTAFLRNDAKAADAERLDGLDSTAFLRSDAKAADAERLDGHDASDFAPAGELHNSGRVTMSDTTPAFDSQYTETTILTVGDLTIEGLCAVDFGGVTANDRAIVQASISGGRSGSIVYSDPAVPPENWGSSSSASLGLAYVFAGVNEVRSGHGMFVGPGDQVISASASAEVNAPDAPCVFGVTAIGP